MIVRNKDKVTSSETMTVVPALLICLAFGTAHASCAAHERSFFALGRVPCTMGDRASSDVGSSSTTSTWASNLFTLSAVPVDPSARSALSWKRTVRGGSSSSNKNISPRLAALAPALSTTESAPLLGTSQSSARETVLNPPTQAFLPKLLKQLKVWQRLPFWPASGSKADKEATPMEQVLGIYQHPRAMTMPIFGTNVWESLTGREFVHHPALVDELAETARNVVAQEPNDDNPWVEWTAVDTDGDLTDGKTIHTWTGISRLQGYGGTQSPWIKTQAILPVAPTLLQELLMDPLRVSSYQGADASRKDLWVNAKGGTLTKICRQVVTHSDTESSSSSSSSSSHAALWHARPIPARNETSIDNVNPSWLVFHRAIRGNAFITSKGIDNNNINVDGLVLLGVHVLEAVPGRPNATRMTNLVHVQQRPNKGGSDQANLTTVSSSLQFIHKLRKMYTKQLQK